MVSDLEIAIASPDCDVFTGCEGLVDIFDFALSPWQCLLLVRIEFMKICKENLSGNCIYKYVNILSLFSFHQSFESPLFPKEYAARRCHSSSNKQIFFIC